MKDGTPTILYTKETREYATCATRATPSPRVARVARGAREVAHQRSSPPSTRVTLWEFTAVAQDCSSRLLASRSRRSLMTK